MTYILPRVQIEQEFTQVPVFSNQPLTALIIGPLYKLFRYAQSSEKANALLTTSYVFDDDTSYAYPNQPDNSVVDQSYVKVFMSNVEAQYFPLAALGSDDEDALVGRVADSDNRIQAELTLKTTVAGDRDAKFSNRDVKPGDIVEITGTSIATADDLVIKTKVARLLADRVPAAIGSVTPDGGNTGGNTTPVAVSSASAFTGTKDITYIVKVIRAGDWYNGSNANTCARVIVTSTGVDSSPAVNVAVNTAFNVGTQGLTIKFPTQVPTGLALNDVWTVAVTAAVDDVTNILEVTDSLADLDSGEDISIKLFVPKASVEIPAVRDATLDTLNWSTDEDAIEIKQGIAVTDPLLVSSETPVSLPVLVGKVYCEYRALLLSVTTAIASLSDPTLVASTLGAVHPDNPLSEGVYDALLNSAGVRVYYIGVASDDLAGYNAALALAKQTTAAYSLVPLTFNQEVKDAVVSHVQTMSTSVAAKWRIAWLSAQLEETSLLLDLKDDESDWTATVGGSPIKTVTIPGATLIDSGVRTGDTLLINFSTNAAGDVVYEEFTIAEVTTQTTLKTSAAFDAAIVLPLKVQIRRNYSKDEQIENLITSGSSINSRRVRSVFPDTCKTAGVVKNGYFVAAALAGLRSGVAPHQGLTNIELLGFDDFSKSVNGFTYDQLNDLAGSGYWIVTQDAVGGTAYTRHQLTTDGANDSGNLNFAEDSITTNIDSISYALQGRLAPFIGVYNINPSSILLVRDAINNELRFRATGTFVPRAGNQLNGFEILEVVQSAIFKDRLEAKVEIEPPYPMNNVTLTLLV